MFFPSSILLVLFSLIEIGSTGENPFDLSFGFDEKSETNENMTIFLVTSSNFTSENGNLLNLTLFVSSENSLCSMSCQKPSMLDQNHRSCFITNVNIKEKPSIEMIVRCETPTVLTVSGTVHFLGPSDLFFHKTANRTIVVSVRKKKLLSRTIFD